MSFDLSVAPQSGGAVLCMIETALSVEDFRTFARQARELVDLAERFGARSLGVYRDAQDDPVAKEKRAGDKACVIVLAFANRPVFEEFSDTLRSAAAKKPWTVEIRLLESLAGFGAPASGEPRIPYHFLKYH